MEQFVTVAIPLIAAFIMIRILLKPMKLLTKLLINTCFGFATLFLLNMLSDYTGFLFELNTTNAVIVGVLGLPGLILLLIFHFFL